MKLEGWAAVGAYLKDHPGEERHTGTFASAGSAASTADAIRTGRNPTLAKLGRFDAHARTVGGEHRVYARYVGPGSTSPEPGPARACNCNPELFGGKHRWQCPSVPAAIVLNDVRGADPAESTKDGTADA